MIYPAERYSLVAENGANSLVDALVALTMMQPAEEAINEKARYQNIDKVVDAIIMQASVMQVREEYDHT